MPHSRHGKASSTKPRRGRSSSHFSKGKQEQPKRLAKNVGEDQPATGSIGPTSVKPPAEESRPWSPWIPGDDGRWFYQGRLKADGSGWEYQFTEGYPPAPRRRDPSLATVYPEPSHTLPYDPLIAVPTVATGTSQIRAAHIEPVNEKNARDQNDEDEDQEDETETYTQAPAQELSNMVPHQSQAVILANPPRPPATKSGSGGGRQAVVKHTGGKSGKKLSAIVKADKERRINSRKRIKTWLSEVTP